METTDIVFQEDFSIWELAFSLLITETSALPN